MRDGPLYPKQVGIQVAFRHPVADLPVQAGVELVFGHRFEDGAAGVGRGVFRVLGHVDGLGGNGDLVDALPRPFEVRSARLDDPHLRIVVALFVLFGERFTQRRIGGGCVAHPFRPSENGFYRPLVLVHRVKRGEHVAEDKPDAKSDDHAE